jgi:drug/metabolite transporter (DMT)-like permease
VGFSGSTGLPRRSVAVKSVICGRGVIKSAVIPALVRLPRPRIVRRSSSSFPMSSLPTQRRDYLKGVLLVFAATVLFSLSGIFVRLLTDADPWRISFYRAGAMVIALLAFLTVLYGRHTWQRFAMLDRRALLAVCLFFALGSTLYILAVSRTSVANVSCLAATAPVFAAVLAWLLLGERSGLTAWLATGTALLGIYVIFRDQFGNIVALVVALCFAGQTVSLRKYRSTDLLPAICVGGLVVCAVMPLVGDELAVDAHDLLLILAMGIVQLAVPIVLFVRAARYVPALPMTLISLLDVVFNPLWAWLGVGEVPSPSALAGGGFIVAAVLLVVTRRRPRLAAPRVADS